MPGASRALALAFVCCSFFSFPSYASSLSIVRLPSPDVDRIQGLQWGSDLVDAEIEVLAVVPTLLPTLLGMKTTADNPQASGSPQPDPNATGAPAAAGTSAPAALTSPTPNPVASVPSPAAPGPDDVPSRLKVTAMLRGKVDKPSGWTILFNNQIVVLDENKDFLVPVPITKRMQWVDFSAVGPKGELEKEKIGLYFQNMDEAIAAKEKGILPFLLVVGLGYQMISYEQTNVPQISADKFSLLLGMEYTVFYPVLYGRADAIIDLATIAMEPEYLDVSFYRGDGKLIWATNFLSSPLKLNLIGGGMIVKMQAEPQIFGFDFVSGVEAYPEIIYRFSDQNQVSAHGRYTVLLTGDLGGSEIRMGGTWTRKFRNGMKFSLDIDYSNLTILDGNVKLSATYFGISTFF
jgi:hypothetical protein